MLWLLILVAVSLTPGLYIRFNPQFGGRLTRARKRLLKQSKNWNGSAFENLNPIRMDVNLKTLPGLLKERFSKNTTRQPQVPIPVRPLDKKAWNTDPAKPKFTWYGHATLLLQINGKNLLIDPMFGPNASPIAFSGIKRFSKNTLDLIDDLPPIDAVLISHDHYDHLDYKSIKKIRGKVDTYFVALGVSRHLERWGVAAEQITEFDWWQSLDFEGIHLTFTPSQHFSGRGLSDRFKSLWGGWVFQNGPHSIYWSGDGGYGDHFKTVTEKLGPFDWAFMECGQYYDLWHQLHLFPEESVQAAIDAQAKMAIPVHWGGFALAMHAWKEPVERFVMAADQKQLPVFTPEIGAVITMGQEPGTKRWYTNLI